MSQAQSSEKLSISEEMKLRARVSEILDEQLLAGLRGEPMREISVDDLISQIMADIIAERKDIGTIGLGQISDLQNRCINIEVFSIPWDEDVYNRAQVYYTSAGFAREALRTARRILEEFSLWSQLYPRGITVEGDMFWIDESLMIRKMEYGQRPVWEFSSGRLYRSKSDAQRVVELLRYSESNT